MEARAGQAAEDRHAEDSSFRLALTVVVPAYDCRDTIPEQLRALAAQDYDGEWEIVVADNGVDDATRTWILAWSAEAPGRCLVDATGGKGASYARNVGTEHARGDFVLYCDADDIVAPWWVSTMAAAARKHDFLGGVDESLDSLPEGSQTPWRRELQGNPYPAIREKHHAFLPWARGGNLGVRASLLQQVGGWDESWLRGQDVELSWRLQLRGQELYRVPEALVRYRRPTGLWKTMLHQYEFGSRAPRLYKAFGHRDRPRVVFARELRRVGWLITRSPYLIISSRRRRSWLVAAAGIAGRYAGSFGSRFEEVRPSKAEDLPL